MRFHHLVFRSNSSGEEWQSNISRLTTSIHMFPRVSTPSTLKKVVSKADDHGPTQFINSVKKLGKIISQREHELNYLNLFTSTPGFLARISQVILPLEA